MSLIQLCRKEVPSDPLSCAAKIIATKASEITSMFPQLSLTLEEECGIWDDYLPTRDDIPQNASTANLLDKVCV